MHVSSHVSSSSSSSSSPSWLKWLSSVLKNTMPHSKPHLFYTWHIDSSSQAIYVQIQLPRAWIKQNIRNLLKLLPFIYRAFKPSPDVWTLCLKCSLKTMEMFIFMSSLASEIPNSSEKNTFFRKDFLLNMQNILVCFSDDFCWFVSEMVVCFLMILLTQWHLQWLFWIKKSEKTTCSGVSILRQRSRVRV